MSAQSQIFNPTLRTSQASGDGFSCPAMNTASRITLNFGVSDRGMMVYDTTLSNVMLWNGTGWVLLGGGLVPVGASLNTEVIYNNAGVLEGDAGLTFNNVTNALTAAGLNVTGATIPANGVYLGAANNLSFSAASTLGMTLDASGNLLVGLASAMANGKLQVAGSIGLSGNTQIRQAIIGDANTLQVFATQFVAGSLNSHSYFYVGNSLVAAVSPGDDVLLLDAGRVASTYGRFKVSNDSTGTNVKMSLEKNGVYTLFADTNSGNVTVGTGNVVMATSGKGIDFSATAGAGTSELFDDYEEGTWTPTDASGAAIAVTGSNCVYTKIGRIVTIEGLINFPVNASAATAAIGGLPFNNVNILGLNPQYGSEATLKFLYGGVTSTISLYTVAQTLITNATMSNDSFMISGTYTAAT